MKIAFAFLFSFASTFSISAQESRLAEQYYQDGEYEKAGILYSKLLEQNKSQTYLFNRLVDCLIFQEKLQDAETIVKKQLKAYPEEAGNYVVYGSLLEKTGHADQAAEQFKKAIDKVPNDRNKIMTLAGTFSTMTKYDEAIATYQKGVRVFNDKEIFPYLLAEIYRRKGDIPNMIKNYLISLDADPQRMATIQGNFQRVFGQSDYMELQKQLYALIQSDPIAIHYPEMMQWAMMQTKDYMGALRQARSLDIILQENGNRLYSIGLIARNASEWDAAIKAFDIITKEKGPQSTLYIDAKKEGLACRREKIKQSASPTTKEELKDLEHDYETFITEFGKNRTTANIIIEQAELEALYINDISKAIHLLEELIALPAIPKNSLSQAKLNLGDYYLIQGDPWESTLLYSQVDKAHKEDQLGEDARYRNARLSYFNGDFAWAQKQFDILKSATSRFISNDAIDLSVFIMDNMAEDSVAMPLQYFAAAELLAFQNKYDAALEKLDSITILWPNHDIIDDVLYQKAQIYSKLKQWGDAIPLYQTVAEKYKEGIRADNALFALAQIYDYRLDNKEKAKELYEKIFIDFNSSTFAVDARKRFRVLRGDKLQ